MIDTHDEWEERADGEPQWLAQLDLSRVRSDRSDAEQMDGLRGP